MGFFLFFKIFLLFLLRLKFLVKFHFKTSQYDSLKKNSKRIVFSFNSQIRSELFRFQSTTNPFFTIHSENIHFLSVSRVCSCVSDILSSNCTCYTNMYKQTHVHHSYTLFFFFKTHIWSVDIRLPPLSMCNLPV